MRRSMIVLGLALLGAAVAPETVHAQVVYRSYAPVVVSPTCPTSPPAVSYYAPVVPSYSAPPVMFSQPAVTYSYYAPPAAGIAPASVVAPAPGIYTTRSYYGYGIFRPRGYHSETTYSPFYP